MSKFPFLFLVMTLSNTTYSTSSRFNKKLISDRDMIDFSHNLNIGLLVC